MSIAGRLADASHNQELAREVGRGGLRFEFELAFTEYDLDQLERHLIATLNPLYNRIRFRSRRGQKK